LLDRDENSVFELSNSLAAQAVDLGRAPRVVPVVGDVRNFTHLCAIFEQHRPQVVLHAAAYKHVPIMESNVCEAVLNNVFGTRAVALAATQFAAERLVMISTDKAVHPSSVMGATKRIAEILITEIARRHRLAPNNSFTRMACVRFGNVVGSRGSVVPIFMEQRKRGKITLTDPRMTRFWITLDQGVRFVIRCIEQMHGGEIFVPKIPSMKLLDMAEAVAPDCQIECVGIRPGEKLHEVLLSEDEARNACETDEMFVIQPAHSWWKKENWKTARPVPENFRYASDSNTQWLSAEDLYALVEGCSPGPALVSPHPRMRANA
jgi:UDP-N-acetylglucosamine 4,6-dehydratase